MTAGVHKLSVYVRRIKEDRNMSTLNTGNGSIAIWPLSNGLSMQNYHE